MIAKKKSLKINQLSSFSLQGSLQSFQLRRACQRTISLASSLQLFCFHLTIAKKQLDENQKLV